MPSAESLQLRALLREHVAPVFSRPTPLADMRAFLDRMGTQGQIPPEVRVEKTSIDRTPAEWLSGPDTKEDRVILFLHGGGYSLGSCASHRELAARIAIASGARALVIEYRLAPENPFPAGLDDAVAAYRWLQKSGIKPGNIVIAGDSAGGGLTVATLLALRDAGDPMPAAAVLMSPWTDLAGTGESLKTRADADPMLGGAGMTPLVGYYIGDRDPKTPLASPLYGDLRGLPPLLVHVGNDEVLLDDSTRLEERARAAGVDVTLKVWDDMWHVFQNAAAMVPESKQAIDEIGSFVRWAMGDDR